MAERCLTLGCPEAVRLALQDPCSGEPVPGEDNGYVLTCIRNWSVEPIVREGEAAEFISDCGNMVVRDRQDDQLLGYTISFETSTRSNELEALVTGGELITSGGLSIGSYKVSSGQACDTGTEDPRFILEGFYKLSRCVTGADHVRIVLPMAQFKVTELDREGTITFYRYTAETGIAFASALGSGPYGDFPVDVSGFLAGRDVDELTSGFDFEEAITITGACGTIEVPAPAEGEGFTILGEDDNQGMTQLWAVTTSTGEIYSAGFSPAAAPGVFRFLSDGTLDTTYGVDGFFDIGFAAGDKIEAMSVDSNDNIIMSITDNGVGDVYLLRLDDTGAIDVTFGVAGLVNIAAGSGENSDVFIEADDDIVVSYVSAGASFIALVSGLDGSITNTTATAGGFILLGATKITDGDYILLVTDALTVDAIRLDTAGNQIDGNPVSGLEPAVGNAYDIEYDGSANVFVVGVEVGNTGFSVIKRLNGLNLVVEDVTFNGTGTVLIDGAYDASLAVVAQSNNLSVLSGSGDLLITGASSNNGADYFWWILRADSADGSLIYTQSHDFGLSLVGGEILDSDVISGTEVLHSGYINDGVDVLPTVAKTLLVDGSLDPTFG